MKLHFGRLCLHKTWACLLVAAAGSGHLLAHDDDAQQVYQRTLRSTVWVIAPRGNRGSATGTGSLIDTARRLVLTNYHVVGDDEQVLVVFPMFHNGELIAEREKYLQAVSKGSGIRGHVLYRDTRRDLAIIELKSVPAGAQALRLADKSPTPGQRVHSVGNTGRSGGLFLYTPGTVRQVYNKKWTVKSSERTMEFDAHVIETQSPTNPGDSGGPLVNDQGQLIGVTQGMAVGAQLLSYFIDLSEVKAFLGSHKLLSDAGTVQSKPEDDEARAERMLRQARKLASEGRFESAKDLYEDILNELSKTKAATEAKAQLEKLSK